MSPKSPALPPGKSRRNTSGKPGRFDPSEPLHMTTRRAAKGGQPNGTPSINGSAEDDESRRGSLDDIRPTTSLSVGSQTSAKGRRISGSSSNGASVTNMSVDLLTSLDQHINATSQNHVSPEHQHQNRQSPSRKRKRSSPTPPDSPTGVRNADKPTSNNTSFLDHEDAVEVIPYEDLTDRDGDSGSETDAAFGNDYLGVAQSTELTPAATPAASEPVSPVSELDNSAIKFSLKDVHVPKLDVKKLQSEAGQADEADDLAEGDEADDGGEVDDDQDDQDGADGKAQRRLAGRRRADHPLTDVEAGLRRQLQLKSAFRTITRALKPVLAEIALKTTEGLETNPTMHEQVVEYQGTDDEPGIKAILDDKLARRKAQLDAQLKWCKEQLLKTHEAEREVVHSKCRASIEDRRDQKLDNLEYDLLIIARQAQLNDGEASYETDDEDGDVLVRPHRTGYKFARSGALGHEYDSRSQRGMETERAIHDLQLRFQMHKMVQEAYGNIEDATARSEFTVMDDAPRRLADSKKESIRNTSLLADAAVEAERLANYKPIPNEEAHALQMLGELASRPSIRADSFPPPMPKRESDIFGPLLHQPQPMLPPPPMRAPFSPEQAHQGHQAMSPRHPINHERMQLPAPPIQPDNRLEYQHRDHPFLSPKANTITNGVEHFSPLANGATFDHEPSPQRHTTSQLPPTTPFGQSPRRPEVGDRTLFGAPTPTRDEIHRDSYQRPLTREREMRHSPERVLHDFSSGPLSIERVKPVEEQAEDTRPVTEYDQAMANDGSPPPHQSHTEPHWEPPVSPGAMDSESTLDPQLRAQVQDQQQDGHAADPRSRASSVVSQSTGTEADENGLGDAGQRTSKPKAQKNYARRTSKADRHGLTRKLYKGGKRQSASGGREKGPSVLRFRLNSEVGTTTQAQPPPWTQGAQAGPPHHMYWSDHYGPPPPFPGGYWTPHHPNPWYSHPPPPDYGYWAHRNSMPPGGGSYGWPPPGPPPHPQSPLYAVPPGAPPPPDMWPTPPNWPPPPPGPQAPMTPQPQTAGAQKATNPPLAPNTDSRLQSGGLSNHPPAFAQQQRNSADGSRRRAQSDTQHTKFKQYQPRPG